MLLSDASDGSALTESSCLGRDSPFYRCPINIFHLTQSGTAPLRAAGDHRHTRSQATSPSPNPFTIHVHHPCPFCLQTKRFLSPSGPSAQHPSKLQQPQQYRSTSPTRAGSNASSPVGRGRGDASGNGERAGGDEYAGRDCSRDETIERITKVLRTKNMEIKVSESSRGVRE